MKKTSVYLDPELDIELARVAHAGGVTKAEWIRRTLRRSVEDQPRPTIAAIGVERDSVSAELAPADRALGERLLAEHDAL